MRACPKCGEPYGGKLLALLTPLLLLGVFVALAVTDENYSVSDLASPPIFVLFVIMFTVGAFLYDSDPRRKRLWFYLGAIMVWLGFFSWVA